jgi:hypothetical protein
MSMKNYEFPGEFHRLYRQAVESYAKGQRSSDGLFSPLERDWIATHGLTTQHLFDYAEDHNNYGGEPGFEHALSIELVRREYFINVQGRRPSGRILEESSLPAKDEAVRGVAWLPRLLPKAKAKLRGELPASLMFGCGGDRNFFKTYDLLPAQFLAVVSRHLDDDAAVVDWVVRHSVVNP